MELRPWKWGILSPRPDGRPRFIWAERANAPIYMGLVALGIPAMSLLVADESVKLRIAATWFAVGFPLYIFLEGRELTGQMAGRGSLDAQQTTKQIGTAQMLYWGAAAAFVFWALGIAFHWQTDPWASPIQYGYVEWTILVHTIIVARISNKIFYVIIADLLKSSPRGERAERRIPPPNA